MPRVREEDREYARRLGPVIGALIAPYKGVDPPTAFVACLLWGYIGIVYLALMPNLPDY